MADQEPGKYTQAVRDELTKEHAQSLADRYLVKAHPSELAAAEFDLRKFGEMSEQERLHFIISERRGDGWELFLALAGLAAFYGAGAMLQQWFPYTWGRVPIIPTTLGVVGVITSLGMKRKASFRYGVGAASVGFALGGGSVTGKP